MNNQDDIEHIYKMMRSRPKYCNMNGTCVSPIEPVPFPRTKGDSTMYTCLKLSKFVQCDYLLETLMRTTNTQVR